MFPKAHAVAYVMMAFRIAYFKVHHKEAFYAVYFSTKGTAFSAEIVLKGIDNVRVEIDIIQAMEKKERTAKDDSLCSVLQMVEEAIERGIKFAAVDLYKSEVKNFKIVNNRLLCPFTSIDGLGENAAAKLVEERAKGEFISIEDCKKRTRLSKKVLETLKEHDCFDGIPDSDQLELF